jgi:hypothetical protein
MHLVALTEWGHCLSSISVFSVAQQRWALSYRLPVPLMETLKRGWNCPDRQEAEVDPAEKSGETE